MFDDLDKLLLLLGSAISNPSTVAAFSELGVDLSSELDALSGTSRAYIERKSDGTSFAFRNDLRSDGAHVLDGVFLYAEGKDDYAQYGGKLPSGISFSNSRDEILGVLGPATWQRTRDDGSVVAEKWNIDRYFMHITWSKRTSCPTVILFGLQALEPEHATGSG